MRNKLLIFLFFAISFQLHSQHANDSISIRQKGSTLEFFQNNQILKLKEVRSILKPNQQAHDQFAKAELNYYTSYAFQAIGGFIIGYTFANSIAGKDLNYYSLGSGVASILLSIPFVNAFQNRSESAVQTYNQQFRDNGDTS